MVWFIISLGISYAIIQPNSFSGFIVTILFSFIIDIVAVLLATIIGRK